MTPVVGLPGVTDALWLAIAESRPRQFMRGFNSREHFVQWVKRKPGVITLYQNVEGVWHDMGTWIDGA